MRFTVWNGGSAFWILIGRPNFLSHCNRPIVWRFQTGFEQCEQDVYGPPSWPQNISHEFPNPAFLFSLTGLEMTVLWLFTFSTTVEGKVCSVHFEMVTLLSYICCNGKIVWHIFFCVSLKKWYLPHLLMLNGNVIFKIWNLYYNKTKIL